MYKRQVRSETKRDCLLSDGGNQILVVESLRQVTTSSSEGATTPRTSCSCPLNVALSLKGIFLNVKDAGEIMEGLETVKYVISEIWRIESGSYING